MKPRQRRNQRARLRILQGNCCYYCGRPFTKKRPATIDHFVPRSRGGSNDLRNLRLACIECNHRKADGVVADRPAPRRAVTYPFLRRHNTPLTKDDWKQVASAHGAVCLLCGQNVQRPEGTLIYLDYGGRYRAKHRRIAHARCVRRLPPLFVAESKQLLFSYDSKLPAPARPRPPVAEDSGQFVLPGLESFAPPKPSPSDS
jgi:hypothetical protein